MAYPSVLSRFNAQSTANTTSPSFTFPTVDAGDRVVLCVGKDDAVAITAFGSLAWNVIAAHPMRDAGDNDQNHIYVLWRDCDGSEDGTTITLTGDSENYAFRGWVLDAGTFNPDIPPVCRTSRGTSGAADPPALAPRFGTVDTLWLTWVLVDGNSTVTGFPSGYGNTGSATSTSGTTGDRVTHGWSEKTANASSDDPGAFTNTNTHWTAVTIAIAPVDAASTAPQLLGLQTFNSTTQSPSLSCVVPTGTELAVANFIGFSGGTLSMSTITLNSVTRDSIYQVAGAGARYACGRAVWANPTAGSRTLAPSWSAAPSTLGGAIYTVSYWANVDTASPIRDDENYQAEGSGTSGTATVDSTTSDAVIGYCASYIPNGHNTALDSSAQQLLSEFDNETCGVLVRELAPGASSTTMEGAGAYTALVVTAIKFAAAAATLSAALSTTATVTGGVTGGTGLGSAPSTTASLAGALGHTLDAAPSTTATVAGALTGETELEASASTTASVTGALDGETDLGADPSTTATVGGTLDAKGDLESALSTTATIAGTFDETQDNLEADLSTTATVSAAPGAIVSISAALSTTAGLTVNTGNDDDYYPSPDVDEAVKSPYPPDYIPDPDEPEYVNDPPDGR